MASFSERLRDARKKNTVTQKSVATAIGITERNYQRYEREEVQPNMATLIALADYFDVSLDYLVGRSDNPKRC